MRLLFVLFFWYYSKATNVKQKKDKRILDVSCGIFFPLWLHCSLIPLLEFPVKVVAQHVCL